MTETTTESVILRLSIGLGETMTRKEKFVAKWEVLAAAADQLDDGVDATQVAEEYGAKLAGRGKSDDYVGRFISAWNGYGKFVVSSTTGKRPIRLSSGATEKVDLLIERIKGIGNLTAGGNGGDNSELDF